MLILLGGFGVICQAKKWSSMDFILHVPWVTRVTMFTTATNPTIRHSPGPGEDPPRCNDATCQKDVLVGDIGRDKTHRAFGLKTSPVRITGAKHGRNQEKRVRDWEIEELVGLWLISLPIWMICDYKGRKLFGGCFSSSLRSVVHLGLWVRVFHAMQHLGVGTFGSWNLLLCILRATIWTCNLSVCMVFTNYCWVLVVGRCLSVVGRGSRGCCLLLLGPTPRGRLLVFHITAACSLFEHFTCCHCWHASCTSSLLLKGVGGGCNNVPDDFKTVGPCNLLPLLQKLGQLFKTKNGGWGKAKQGPRKYDSFEGRCWYVAKFCLNVDLIVVITIIIC